MTDPAVARARSVVGLYGDPTVSWSIGLDVSFTQRYDVPRLLERCAAMVAGHPGLGRPPAPVKMTGDDPTGSLRALLDMAYGDEDPLVRVAYDADGRRLVVAAHHGAVDGLGLLALLALLLGQQVTSTARGIGVRSATVGFVRSSLARLREAAFTPPVRLAADLAGRVSRGKGGGDVTASHHLTLTPANTPRSIAATAEAVAHWNRRHGAPTGPKVAAVGASRRDGSAAAPDRDTAYLRLRLQDQAGPDAVARALRTTDPEPTFPERTPGRVMALVPRVLRSRLGATFLVSNLGLVDAPRGVERIAFFPTAAGPRALAVGVASTSSYTTVTVRMPSADFDDAAAAELCALVADRLAQYGS